MIDLHAKKVDVKFSRPRQVFDVKHHMIDTGDFEW
jgi:hypothetical protein